MKIYLSKSQWVIFLINLVYLIVFSYLYLQRGNLEFMIYIGVIILFFVLILLTNYKVKFSNGILIGLTIWGIMHMSGGYFKAGEGVLYGLQIIPIYTGIEFVILRFDQLVHAIGFGVATLVAFNLIKPYLNKEKVNWKVLSCLVVLMGMGIGALNEIIEFITVVLLPQTGVGGYYNTMLDICFNTFGAIIAVIWINFRERKV
ncbi:MAG: DUF2238 domain-containing protein [archaeon]